MSEGTPPILSVHPCQALVDETFSVVVENLPPGRPVTVRSLHQSEDKDFWEAYGHYVSDHHGTVSVSEDLSLGGTYRGKEPMGLLWSMRPVPGSRTGLRLRKVNVCAPLLLDILVYSGHDNFRDIPPLASTLVERWYMAPGVKRIEINEKGIRGMLLIPPGPGPFPGLLDLWGGGGGLNEYRAALLASHGYASLAVDYFKAGELKTKDMELTFFEIAFDILKEHPQVLSDRVGIIGLCLGSLIALSLAAYSTNIKPYCIICISNIHSIASKKAIGGFQKEIPAKFRKMRVDENNCHIWRDVGLALLEEPSLKVDVRKINCPMLLLNGCDDQNWPSVEAADDIYKMMRAAGKEHLVAKVDYPGAGHLIEPPFSPQFRATSFGALGAEEKVIVLWGGETKAHSDAQEDSWKKILSFLQQHMYRNPSTKSKM
ncbi:peroxisomal succinyl-coenzyme A thioesterase-like [Cololabis saira]|uniref:peroxisomal succinyl-coenzyme A thioesterase-like n=1 Tax=Cololabis saira TaxID=129043 RepID=UPI002AD470B2|nr:peroxisomal succinyl-coenzyme A thioesterase-like [Cololabis saira]